MEKSASYQAGQSIAGLVVPLLTVAGILWLGYWFSGRLTRKREDGVAVRWPIWAAFALVVLMILGQCAAPPPA